MRHSEPTNGGLWRCIMHALGDHEADNVMCTSAPTPPLRRIQLAFASFQSCPYTSSHRSAVAPPIMEVVGAVASVITLVGVAKTSVKAFSFLEEIRETQNDYRLLRREVGFPPSPCPWMVQGNEHGQLTTETLR